MFNPKPEIYQTLNALGYYCRQGAQATFADSQVPAITFRIEDNNVEQIDHDLEIARQSITVTVDIFADDSVATSRILNEVEEAMRGIHYRMSHSSDIPAPAEALCHTNARFVITR
jgi:hypothetical protein